MVYQLTSYKNQQKFYIQLNEGELLQSRTIWSEIYVIPKLFAKILNVHSLISLKIVWRISVHLLAKFRVRILNCKTYRRTLPF
jgi:hypothetical protein